MGDAATKASTATVKRMETQSARLLRISEEVSRGCHERVVDFSDDGLYKLFFLD